VAVVLTLVQTKQNTVNTSTHITKTATHYKTHTPTHYRTSQNNHSTRYTPNEIVTIIFPNTAGFGHVDHHHVFVLQENVKVRVKK
jgi:hypothetical protein